MDLEERYPPSEPCTCAVCLAYCKRPGWWTLREAEQALDAGLAPRMMLEMAPELTFGVLSPAFRGCEVAFATNTCAPNGCNFLVNDRCELHGTGHQPLECRVCHHDRPGLGQQCHDDIEKEWNTPEGRKLVGRWGEMTGFFAQLRALLSAEKPPA
jgi:hypothetical protein